MNEPSVTAPDSTPVVVMDDSRSARFALGKFLEAMGCQVSSVADLPALMAALDAQPAAMLIVEHDPADVGFERLRQIKSHPNAASVPVVLSLSDALPDFDAQAFAQGAAAVMVKPPSRDSVAALIDGLLGGARAAPVIVSPPADTARAEQLTQQMAEQAADIRAGIASLITPAPATTPLDADVADPVPAQAPAASQERPIAEQLRALESRLSALEQSVENELMELRVQLDLSLQAQSDRIDQGRDMLQAMVIEQAQAVAERTVMNAASRISDRLAESILKTINRNATSGHDPSTTS